MISHHLRQTKKFFIGLVTLLVLFIAFGSISFERTNFITRGADAFALGARTLAYRMEYHRHLALASATGASGDRAADAAAQEAVALPVLLYHGIIKKADRFSVTEETFKEQLFALKRAGWRTVTLEEARAFLTGAATLPDKSFLLTFDDGRTDSYYGADPVLRALGFTAVMYVAVDETLAETDDAGDRYYLDRQTLQAMLDSRRWEIGSHALQESGGKVALDAAGTEGNFLSSRKWLDEFSRPETAQEYEARLAREIASARGALEQTFATDITSFSYPFGDFGQQDAAARATIAREVRATYAMAFQQVWPKSDTATFNYPGDDMYHLRRLEVGTDWSGAELVAFLDAAHAKSIPFFDDLAVGRSWWKSGWGTMAFDADGMSLVAPAGVTGAAAFLDGSQQWKDYFFSADASWERGSHVTLMARYRDGENYAGCTFGEGSVRAERVVRDGKTTLGVARGKRAAVGNDVTLGISVEGGSMRCFIDGQAVGGVYTLGQEPPTGGIGVKIWDQAPGNSTLKIRSVQAVSTEAATVLITALPRR